MHTDVYTYVYTSVYTYVYTYVYPYVYTYVFTYVYTHVYTCAYTYVYTYVYTYETQKPQKKKLKELWIGVWRNFARVSGGTLGRFLEELWGPGVTTGWQTGDRSNSENPPLPPQLGRTVPGTLKDKLTR